MPTRLLIVILFLAGTLLGLGLRGEKMSSPLVWAGPIAPILQDGDVGLARRIAPAMNLLLLSPTEDEVYLPLIQSGN